MHPFEFVLGEPNIKERGRRPWIRRRRTKSARRATNTIARNVTTGDFDLVLTTSIVSMQTVANANHEERTKHVFGASLQERVAWDRT